MTSAAMPSSQDLVASDAPDGDVLTPAMRGHHRWMLWVAGIVAVLAFVFDVSADHEHVFVRRFPNIVMPGSCLSREIFHMDCPGCGLTRSIVFLVHGEVRASWQMNRVGWLMALAIVGQVPYRVMCLRRGRRVLGKVFPRLFGLFLILMLVGNWALGLMHI